MTRPSKKKPGDPKQEFRELLRASGWSQAEAARQLAMSPSALSQIVRDNSPVRPSAVTLRLFRFLLERGRSGPAPASARAEKAATEEPWEADMLESLRKIPPKEREAIFNAIRAMLAAAQTNSRGKRSSGQRPPGGGATEQ